MSDTEIKAAPEAEQQPVPQMEPAIQEMMDAGVFFGCAKSKTHPRVKQFVIANRNGVDIINLEKTKEQLATAMDFIKSKAAKNAKAILVATQPPAHESAKKMSKEFDLPTVTLRWLGGTLTNYKVISHRVEYFKKLKSDLAANAFSEYTKKEQLDLQKEAEKMEEVFSGMESMTTRPELLLVVDPVFHKTAVEEARRLQIPIVAFANTDTDLDHVDYPVLGNTKARTSINWFMDKLNAAWQEGVQAASQAAAKAKEEAADKSSDDKDDKKEKEPKKEEKE